MNTELEQYRREAELISLRKRRDETQRQLLRLGDEERYMLKEMNKERLKLMSRVSLFEAQIKRLEDEYSE